MYSIKVDYRRGGSDVFGIYKTFDEAVEALRKHIAGKYRMDNFDNNVSTGFYYSEDEVYEIIKLI